MQVDLESIRTVLTDVSGDDLEITLHLTPAPDDLWTEEFRKKARELFEERESLPVPTLDEDAVAFVIKMRGLEARGLEHHMKVLIEVIGQVATAYAPQAEHRAAVEEAARMIILEQLDRQ
jgi:hypothetical protein